MMPGVKLHLMLLVITWSIKEAEESLIRAGLFKKRKKNSLEFSISMYEAAGSYIVKIKIFQNNTIDVLYLDFL